MLVVVGDLVKMPADLTARVEAVVLPIAEAEVLLIAAELLELLLFPTPDHKKALAEQLLHQGVTPFTHSQLVVHIQLNKGETHGPFCQNRRR
jgi:hypothetical protein